MKRIIRPLLLLFTAMLLTQCHTSKSITQPQKATVPDRMEYQIRDTVQAISPVQGMEQKQVQQQKEENYNPRVLIIYYDTKTGKAALLKAVKAYRAELIYDYHNFSAIAISLPKDKTADTAIPHFQKIKGVLSVQRDRIYKLTEN